MLQKIHRLTKKKDFETVFKKGETVKQDFLIYKIAKNPLDQNRFGFVVSKKISTKAVVRNKVKRRLSESVKGIFLSDTPKKSIDLIMIALPGIEKKEFSEIKESVAKAFKKLKLT